jgi:acyl dehydratase
MTEASETMRILEASVDQLPDHIGAELGPSSWRRIDQDMIDRFADMTGDTHWIHTDPERARRELPGGRTIAHGYLTLSLLTGLIGEMLQVRFGRALNYGLDRVRFISPVPADARVRLLATLDRVTAVADNGMKIEVDCTMEIEDADRPALAAQSMSIYYP